MYTYVSLGVITIHWYSVYTYVSLGVITIHRYALGHSKSYCCFWSGGFLCYAQAGGTSATQFNNENRSNRLASFPGPAQLSVACSMKRRKAGRGLGTRLVIASIFAHATSQKNEELLHGSTRLPNLQYLPRDQKTICFEGKTCSPLTMQSLSHHREAVTLSEN